MGTLELDLRVPLRAFDVELTLAVDGPVALVGPSGAGKTTVLRAIAGLADGVSGRVVLGDATWLATASGIDVPAERRRVGFVFQNYALFPHLTVERNVAFAGGDPAPALERLGIAHLAREKPDRLSGGERQRVALARALSRNPDVLLLDEPLSALDTHTRGVVRGELRELLRTEGLPALVVTHDFEDAAVLADRVGVIVDGRLRQIGTPAELVAAPADAFVASFTGANVLSGVATRDHAGLTRVSLDGGLELWSAEVGVGPVAVSVHPWEVSLARDAPTDSAVNHVRAPISAIVPLGNRVRVGVGPITAEVTAESLARLGLTEGESVVATFKATATRLLTLA